MIDFNFGPTSPAVKSEDLRNREPVAQDWTPRSDDPSDPVHFDAQGWWFWNEVWADRLGPYESEAECVAALKAYAEQL